MALGYGPHWNGRTSAWQQGVHFGGSMSWLPNTAVVCCDVSRKAEMNDDIVVRPFKWWKDIFYEAMVQAKNKEADRNNPHNHLLGYVKDIYSMVNGNPLQCSCCGMSPQGPRAMCTVCVDIFCVECLTLTRPLPPTLSIELYEYFGPDDNEDQSKRRKTGEAVSDSTPIPSGPPTSWTPVAAAFPSQVPFRDWKKKFHRKSYQDDWSNYNQDWTQEEWDQWHARDQQQKEYTKDWIDLTEDDSAQQPSSTSSSYHRQGKWRDDDSWIGDKNWKDWKHNQGPY